MKIKKGQKQWRNWYLATSEQDSSNFLTLKQNIN